MDLSTMMLCVEAAKLWQLLISLRIFWVGEMGIRLLRPTQKHSVSIDRFAMIVEERMLLFKQRKATSTRST